MQADEIAAVVVQTIKRALAPVLADVRGLQVQLATQEARWGDLGALRERVAVVEAKATLPAPVVVDTRPAAADELLVDLRARLAALETTPAELAGARERLAVLETRAPVPGPAGQDGKDGHAGADGLGFEDLDVALEGDRALVFRFARGDREKTFRVVVPWLVNQDLWVDSKGYVPGDVVSWEGSAWVCKDATTGARPGVSPIWKQLVTKGRQGAQGKMGPAGADGKDGRDGMDLTQMDGSGHKWR